MIVSPRRSRSVLSPPGATMTRLSKRSFVQLAGWGSLAALAVLSGCSKEEKSTTTTTATPAATTTTRTTSTTTAAAASATATASGPLKIAFAYVGPVGDGGWTFAHDNAR